MWNNIRAILAFLIVACRVSPLYGWAGRTAEEIISQWENEHGR